MSESLAEKLECVLKGTVSLDGVPADPTNFEGLAGSCFHGCNTSSQTRTFALGIVATGKCKRLKCANSLCYSSQAQMAKRLPQLLFSAVLVSKPSNPAFERSAAKARRPSTSR